MKNAPAGKGWHTLGLKLQIGNLGRNRTKRDHDTIKAASHEKRLKSSVVMRWNALFENKWQQESGQRTRLASTSGTFVDHLC